jgi:CheY-like chemotaxis protein
MSQSHITRILVVDDERDSCENLSDILSDMGYQVDIACDGPSAIELVRENHYDIALLDLRMPGMDGLTLYREIRKLRAGTVAILVTAYSGGTTTEDALQAGMWQVLPKPADLPRLLKLIETARGQPLLLLVDDDTELCENLWQVLRDAGYRVALAHDIAGAAEQLRGAHYEVALIDMKLAAGSGAEVFQLVRSLSPHARTVVITGCRPETDPLVDRVMSEGADAACFKPFDVPGLMKTLHRLTSGRG